MFPSYSCQYALKTSIDDWSIRIILLISNSAIIINQLNITQTASQNRRKPVLEKPKSDQQKLRYQKQTSSTAKIALLKNNVAVETHFSLELQNLQQFKKWKKCSKVSQEDSLFGPKSPATPGGQLQLQRLTSILRIHLFQLFQLNFSVKIHMISSVLPFSKIVKYTEYREQFSKKASSSRKLKESIEIAENIINGKLSVEDELARIKVRLFQPQPLKVQLKTAVSIQDRNIKEVFEVESTQVSCCPSVYPASNSNNSSQHSSQLQEVQLGSEDVQVLKEIQTQGINQDNVIDILQYGLIDRLENFNKQKALKLRKIAKKTLIQKYFGKTFPKITMDEKKQKQEIVIKSSKRKRINKQLRQVKTVIPAFKVEVLCVRKLHQILKLCLIEPQVCRKISSQVVIGLKQRSQIESIRFQRGYLGFIEWVKEHKTDSDFIERNYNDYLQGQTSQDHIQKRSQQLL